MKLFHKFAGEVISSFLSEDKRGEFVSLVIDDQFMENAANIIGKSKDYIIKDIKTRWLCVDRYYDYSTESIETIISIVAIQLYAASKMENDSSGNYQYTDRAYYVHFNEVLSIDNCYQWIKGNKDFRDYSNQDKLWMRFYEWCNSQDLIVNQLYPKIGRGRYTQYPLNLAKHTFNREDLKYISSVFQKTKIYVNEDIRYTDFWKLLDIRWSFANLSNHCTRVLESIYADTCSYDIAKSQIYNHFLTWNGEYKDPSSFQSGITSIPNDKQISISNKSGIYEIYVRNRDTEELINKITIDRKILTSLNAHYKLKRDGVIIFQQNRDYPNVWDEIRYLETRDAKGLAIVINKPYLLGHSTRIYCCDNVCLYEFDYNEQTHKYYSEESQVYELIGGLRVARQTYLSNGAPILRLHQDSYYLLNGKIVNQVKGDYLLDLDEGEYALKFQRRREFRITITPPSTIPKEWSDKFCKWELSREKHVWASRRDIDGIVGVDYRIYSTPSNSQAILQRWVKVQQGETVNDNNNITLKLLNNQNRYE